MKNLINGIREYHLYLNNVEWNDNVVYIGMNVDYDIHECDLGFIDGPVIRPNQFGIILLAAWERYVLEPLRCYKRQTCKHPNLVDESYGGPDRGCEVGHCPDCGWAFHVTMY